MERPLDRGVTGGWHHDFDNELSAMGVSVSGQTTQSGPEEWGPDAKVLTKIGRTEVGLIQHTEGRGNESGAMLDLSPKGEKFDLWKIGWSTSVKIPDSDAKVNLLDSGNVKPHDEGGCTPAFPMDKN